MAEDTYRSVRIERVAVESYQVHNVRGGTISIWSGKNGANYTDFTPVELLLAAIGGCTAIDVDMPTSRRTEPAAFTVRVGGDKITDRETGNRMENLTVTFEVTFPDGPDGDAARTVLPRAVKLSHDKLCTVSRTVELGSPVRSEIKNP